MLSAAARSNCLHSSSALAPLFRRLGASGSGNDLRQRQVRREVTRARGIEKLWRQRYFVDPLPCPDIDRRRDHSGLFGDNPRHPPHRVDQDNIEG
jgi:hypothetical protein